MSGEMRQALAERHGLIEARATALLDTALADGQSWAAGVSAPPKDARAAAAWRRHLLTVAAYRDRHGVTDTAPLGAPADDVVQKIDAARARVALDQARSLTDAEQQAQRPARGTGQERVGPTL